MASYIKLSRNYDKTIHYYPNAFNLLAIIALRAKRSESFINSELEIGEALIGDHKSYGLSEKNYRTAKKKLEKMKIVAFKGTTKGTIAKLIDSSIFDINLEEGGEQKGGRGADEGRTRGGRGATKKNEKKLKNEKKEDNIRPKNISAQTWDDFILHRKSKKAPITQTVIESLAAEAVKAGISLEAAIKECCVRNWQGFKAEWYLKDKAQGMTTIISSPPKQSNTKCHNPDCVNGWIPGQGRSGREGYIPTRMCECLKKLQPKKEIITSEIKKLVVGIGIGVEK